MNVRRELPSHEATEAVYRGQHIVFVSYDDFDEAMHNADINRRFTEGALSDWGLENIIWPYVTSEYPKRFILVPA